MKLSIAFLAVLSTATAAPIRMRTAERTLQEPEPVLISAEATEAPVFDVVGSMSASMSMSMEGDDTYGDDPTGDDVTEAASDDVTGDDPTGDDVTAESDDVNTDDPTGDDVVEAASAAGVSVGVASAAAILGAVALL
jgi:hypothetical protein